MFETTNGGPAAGRPALLRPPIVFAAAIVAGVVFHLAWPLVFSLRAARWPIGVALSVAGAVLFVSAIRELRATGTPVQGHLPPRVIVRGGPYRFSRNPIYLSFALMHLGIAVWVGSWWLLATFLASITLIAIAVVPREERYLEERFGSSYGAYKSSVRRWL